MKLNSLNVNLSNPNSVKSCIASLGGNVIPFISVAKPLLRKISPKIEQITGFTIDSLLDEFGNSTQKNNKPHNSNTSYNIYNKYKNL